MPIFEPNYLNLEYFFNQFYRFLVGIVPWLVAFFSSLSALRIFLLAFSLILLVVIAVLVYKISQLRQNERRTFFNLVRTTDASLARQSERWTKIVSALDSDNPADWKQAIIEADIMLDEMVKAMNYPGENLGEWLKAIEPSDFLTLEDAWEGHKLRNRIAHESDFVLTRREARQTLDRFERVFREFSFI